MKYTGRLEDDLKSGSKRPLRSLFRFSTGVGDFDPDLDAVDQKNQEDVARIEPSVSVQEATSLLEGGLVKAPPPSSAQYEEHLNKMDSEVIEYFREREQRAKEIREKMRASRKSNAQSNLVQAGAACTPELRQRLFEEQRERNARIQADRDAAEKRRKEEALRVRLEKKQLKEEAKKKAAEERKKAAAERKALKALEKERNKKKKRQRKKKRDTDDESEESNEEAERLWAEEQEKERWEGEEPESDEVDLFVSGQSCSIVYSPVHSPVSAPVRSAVSAVARQVERILFQPDEDVLHSSIPTSNAVLQAPITTEDQVAGPSTSRTGGHGDYYKDNEDLLQELFGDDYVDVIPSSRRSPVPRQKKKEVKFEGKF